MAGLQPWDSNHTGCDIVKVNIFKHLLTKRMTNYFFAIINSENRILSHLRYHIMFISEFKKCMETRFNEQYTVPNFMHNDKNALLSRVDYVQRNEPRSYYNSDTI